MSALPLMARLERQIDRAEAKPRRRAKTIPNVSFEEREREAAQMIASGTWVGARPVHFVALYSLGHAKCYGVPAADLSSRARMTASALAARMLRDHFGGDPDAMYAFVKWVWLREREREEWRRANGRDGKRISWSLQFSNALLTDYRLSLQRRR